MRLPRPTDIVVIGGGPGGASAAIRLALLGFKVVLVERAVFPRAQVGICLSEGTAQIFDYLGVGADFAAQRFWFRSVTVVDWGSDGPQLVAQPGYHVDRGAIDLMLLKRAVDVGVVVYQPAKIISCRRDATGSWDIQLVQEGHDHSLRSTFLVDATGRRGAHSGRRVKDGHPLLAMHATWLLMEPPRFDGLIEAGASSWTWYAKTSSKEATISVFVDPRDVRAHISPQRLYLEALYGSKNLGPNHLARCITGLKMCDASSHHAATAIGDNHVCVGDALLAVDPISSQGVHLALQSGLQAAACINTTIVKPRNRDLARQFYTERAADRIRLYTQRTDVEYARAASTLRHPFWQERAAGATAIEPDDSSSPRPAPGPTTRVCLSPALVIEDAPVLDGDLVATQSVARLAGSEIRVAYLCGVPITDLLGVMPESIEYAALPLLWMHLADRAGCNSILAWLWTNRVLVAAE